MLAAAPGIGYIHEPFNVDLVFGYGPSVTNWYQHIDATNAAEFEGDVSDLLACRYPLPARLMRARSPKDLVRILKNKNQLDLYRRQQARLLVKDPLAFFAAEWLAERFSFDVAVMIRHPAAFCSSLQLKNWNFDFAHLARQPRLLDTLLGDYADQIEDFAVSPRDLIDQAILLWNCIHHVASHYKEKHRDWIFVRHEDLSRDPQAEFRLLYERLNLDFSDKVAAAIEEASGAHNPAEQTATDEFARDSRANIFNWKSRLAAKEIERIKQGTCVVAPRFYDEEDW